MNEAELFKLLVGLGCRRDQGVGGQGSIGFTALREHHATVFARLTASGVRFQEHAIRSISECGFEVFPSKALVVTVLDGRDNRVFWDYLRYKRRTDPDFPRQLINLADGTSNSTEPLYTDEARVILQYCAEVTGWGDSAYGMPLKAVEAPQREPIKDLVINVGEHVYGPLSDVEIEWMNETFDPEVLRPLLAPGSVLTGTQRQALCACLAKSYLAKNLLARREKAQDALAVLQEALEE